jgi:putative ABC transport system ATP-binding protein
VKKNNITTMMITHNLSSALNTGTKTIMMDRGKIVVEIDGDRREGMSINDMLELYSKENKKELDNDRILLSE